MQRHEAIETRTILTVRIQISDEIVEEMRNASEVEVVLVTNSLNREMRPLRLSYQNVRRLTQDA